MDPIPLPPAWLLSADEPTFAPAPELAEWVRVRFVVDPQDPFYNRDHEDLEDASIAFLWASVSNRLRGQETLGMCGLGGPSGGTAWSKGQRAQQLREWFGAIPDFLITLDAEWFAEADDASRLAVIDHELYHARIDVDKFGNPRYDPDTSLPVWGIRPHDVEQFVGVVERWGVFAAGQKMAQLATAIRNGPTIMQATIEGVCGTCGLRVA